MATVVHAKVSAIADDAASVAAGEIVPTDWNAAHSVTLVDADIPATVARWGPDPAKPPTTPNASDDEFTVAGLAGWTTLGTVTANANTTVPNALYLLSAVTGIRVDGIYKAKSPPFTITAKLAAHTIRTVDNRAGIFIGTATPGRIDSMSLSLSGDYYIQCLEMTNPTTYSATIAASAGLLSVMGGRANPFWLQIVVASSTSVNFNYSFDGIYYYTLVSGRNPAMTVGSFGLFVSPQSATNDIAAAFDYIRVT